MKRSYFGLGLLLMLLILGFAASLAMDRIHAPVAWELNEAADFASIGLWPEAEEAAQKARSDWEKWAYLRNSLADHTPIEDAESLFAQLSVFAAEEDPHFQAVCRELSQRVRAMGNAHSFTWWNIL